MSDNVLDETVKLLKPLVEYFENAKDYIGKFDQSRVNKIESIVRNIESSRKGLLGFKKNDTDEYKFVVCHYITTLVEDIHQLYDTLNLPISMSSDNISGTTVKSLNVHFKKVSTLYSVYVRNLDTIVAKMIDSLTLESNNPSELSSLYSEYPNSTDLYTNKMLSLLNSAYKNKDTATVTKIQELIEHDKSVSLGEQPFVSPFLSFGLQSQNLVPKDLQTIIKDLGIRSKITKLSELQEKIGSGIIAVYRIQRENRVIVPPSKLSAPGEGICKIHKPIVFLPDQKEDKWEIKVYGGSECDKYLCLEILSHKMDQIRVLAGWQPSDRYIQFVPRSKLIKVLNRQLGRPDAYHKILDSALIDEYKSSIRSLVTTPIPVPWDIHLWALEIHTAVMESIKRVDIDQKVIEIMSTAFQHAIVQRIPKVRCVDTVLYLINWLDRQFQKDLLDILVQNTFEDDIAFGYQVKEVIDSLLKKHKNIFNIVTSKEYWINSIPD